MSSIGQIKQDKAALAVEIARLIRDFEDKHIGARIGAIETGRYELDCRWKNNGETWVRVEVKMNDLQDRLQKIIKDQISAFENEYSGVEVKTIESVTTFTLHGEFVSFIPKIEIKGL